jgi:hypothetical protein
MNRHAFSPWVGLVVLAARGLGECRIKNRNPRREKIAQPTQVLVINPQGAIGSIAVERVVKSPADGYTLLLITAAATIVPALRSNLSGGCTQRPSKVGPAI